MTTYSSAFTRRVVFLISSPIFFSLTSVAKK